MINLNSSKLIKVLINSLILILFYSCVVVYGDLSKDEIQKLGQDDLNTGIVIQIPKNKKAFIMNDVNIEIYQDTILVMKNEIPWFSRSNLELDAGEYRIDTYIIYMNRKTWKTSDLIRLNDKEIKRFDIKYPFLMTGKPKVTIY